MYNEIRSLLRKYYFEELPSLVKDIKETVFSEMDKYNEENSSLSAYQLKAHMYDVIVRSCQPKIIKGLHFCFDTGVLAATSDGRYRYIDPVDGIMKFHANGWLYLAKRHLFEQLDPEMYNEYRNDKGVLHFQTGDYVDIMHIGLPLGKVIDRGLSGILQDIEERYPTAPNGEAREFLDCARSGILSLLSLSERFAEAAREAGEEGLAEVAARIPRLAPSNYYEGLYALAFMRRAYGSIEGLGFSSFGRVDLLLEKLYTQDIASGVSEAELLDLTAKFLLIWDTALNREKKLESGSGYELENTLTLGGVDENGEPVFNGVTRLFIRARNENDIIYPKMMLRFSSRSPREYMRMIAEPIANGKSYSLIENDDAVIPALTASGIEWQDAVNYAVGGCWDILTPSKGLRNSGEYFSLFRLLEWGVHNDTERFERHRLNIKPFDTLNSVEEIYENILSAVREVLSRKAKAISHGARIWSRVSPAPILSALMDTPLELYRDITAGGEAYNRECVYFSGLAEVVDSLLAIKSLCFDKRVCTLPELIEQCRNNWPNEALRQMAINSPSYGDGSEESSALAARLFNDLDAIAKDMPTAFGGHFHVGYNQYTEIIFWGKNTRAFPNGRRNGDVLSAGLTPSRIQRPISVADVLETMTYIDTRKCSANTSITMSLPAGKIDTEALVDLLYAIAGSHLQALQLNCVDIDTLREAQKEPEKYTDIIVRVCGFSAPFVCLSEHYQEEFISRMLSEG